MTFLHNVLLLCNTSASGVWHKIRLIYTVVPCSCIPVSRYHIPKECNFHQHSCENFKSKTFCSFRVSYMWFSRFYLHHKAQELCTNCGRLTMQPVHNLCFWCSIIEILPFLDVAQCWLIIYFCHLQPTPQKHTRTAKTCPCSLSNNYWVSPQSSLKTQLWTCLATVGHTRLTYRHLVLLVFRNKLTSLIYLHDAVRSQNSL